MVLYNLNWLKKDQKFPPEGEADRIEQYKRNAEHFDLTTAFDEFSFCASKLMLNWKDYIDFPMILHYQRLVTIKLADMVCGAFPSITTKEDKSTDLIQGIRDTTDFDNKVYEAVVDFSRFGVMVLRVFTDEETDRGNFCIWNPMQWFPILRDDGTKRVKMHVLAWRVNEGTTEQPKWKLMVQKHPIEGKSYTVEKYEMNDSGDVIKDLEGESNVIDTAGYPCLVQYATNLSTTTNVYGTSDYAIINKLVKKASERCVQILRILDAHADPSLMGPDTLLTPGKDGVLELKMKQFFAIGAEDAKPQYLTWDGKLDSAFKALEALIQQLYILSEMGSAFLGDADGAGQAISGTAMRFKMVAPLSKARRVCNSLTLPTKKLMTVLLKYENVNVQFQDISVKWDDSLPKDPREQAELTKVQTGAPQIMPLKTAIMEQYDLTSTDADKWIEDIEKDQERFKTDENGVPNATKKGSDMALVNGTEGSTGTKSRTETK